MREGHKIKEHRQTQPAKREYVFDEDRLHVVRVIRDDGLSKRAEAPQDRQMLPPETSK